MQSEQKDKVMALTSKNSFHVQIWQCMGILAEDERMMKRVAKYVAKLVKEKEQNVGCGHYDDK